MTDEIKPGEMMPAWYLAECDSCGCDFRATRAKSRKRPPAGDLLCESCSMYAQGYADGLAVARHTLRAALKGLENE